MRVKPASGLQVRDPATLQLLPDEGFELDPTNLDHARLYATGDLVDDDTPAETGKPKKGA